MILTADWHLTDKPEDEYRWNIFDVIKSVLIEHPQPVFILGDITDRADRHRGALVNRLVDSLMALAVQAQHNIVILAGNHDAPALGPHFFNFANELRLATLKGELYYVCTPKMYYHQGKSILLLPWSDNPLEAWKKEIERQIDGVFMHQPVTGAVGENGVRLSDVASLPVFPRSCKIYSGDIHTPQRVGRIEYVGAPFHIKFGDSYKTRILMLNNDLRISKEITVRMMRKHLVETAGFDLPNIEDLEAGDQIKIRASLSPDHMAQWPAQQEKLREWAQKKEVTISSIETIVAIPQSMHAPEEDRYVTGYDPLYVIGDYITNSERLTDDDLINHGINLLKAEIEFQRSER